VPESVTESVPVPVVESAGEPVVVAGHGAANPTADEPN
jgi:hypothetical protein